MNKYLNYESFKVRVSPEQEDVFHDSFWENLDFVVNALDNEKSRRYVDSRCVLHKKTLFESGIEGTKCSSQIILPMVT